MPRNKNEDLGLIIGLVLVGIVLLWIYVIQPFSVWVSQNLILVSIGIGVVIVLGLAFIFKIWLPSKQETDSQIQREDELKRSIIRKRIHQERATELEKLNLTEEEREYQLNQWVEQAYRNEILGYGSKSAEFEPEPEIERVPPLSQKEKEIMIHIIGTKCCYPNCHESIALEVHHIIPREEGGTNKENNLVVLCTNHHHLADRGAIPRDRLKLYCIARLKRIA